MRLINLAIFCLLLATAVFPQRPIIPMLETPNKPILKFKSQVDVGGMNEYIITTKFLDDDYKLLVITNLGIKVWNIKTAEIIKSYPHNIQDIEKFNTGFAVNPNGTRAIVYEIFEFSLKKLFRKKIVSAAVYGLETGEKITEIERPKESIRRAFWTEDGKTLITFSNPSVFYFGKTEISFWNGETLEFRGSITTDKGIYLTQDGKRFITSSPITQNTLGYKNDNQNAIKIWNLQTLKIEKDFPLSQKKSLNFAQTTPDESHLITESNGQIFLINLESGQQKTFTTKENAKINDVQISLDKKYLTAGHGNKVFIWETEGNSLPKFEIVANQPIDKYYFSLNFSGFSEDGKFAVVSHSKYKKALGFLSHDFSFETQYYNLESGKLEPNLNTYLTRSNSIFSADKLYGISTTCDKATIYNNKTQEELYIFPLNCKSRNVSTTDSNGEIKTETEHYNDDIIVFHPKKNFSLVAKDDVLEIYSVNPEQRQLQRIFTPKDLDKTSFNKHDFENRISRITQIEDGDNNPLKGISSVGFLFDGSIVYAVSKDRKSVTFWEVNQDLVK